MATKQYFDRPEQEALFLLAPDPQPDQRFRLDDATIERGRRHIARIRAEMAERRALSAIDGGLIPVRAQLGSKARRGHAA